MANPLLVVNKYNQLDESIDFVNEDLEGEVTWDCTKNQYQFSNSDTDSSTTEYENQQQSQSQSQDRSPEICCFWVLVVEGQRNMIAISCFLSLFLSLCSGNVLAGWLAVNDRTPQLLPHPHFSVLLPLMYCLFMKSPDHINILRTYKSRDWLTG